MDKWYRVYAHFTTEDILGIDELTYDELEGDFDTIQNAKDYVKRNLSTITEAGDGDIDEIQIVEVIYNQKEEYETNIVDTLQILPDSSDEEDLEEIIDEIADELAHVGSKEELISALESFLNDLKEN